ncbi:sphingolipid delta(4)-desaturase DES1-like isoform X1 [Mya arenaria]|uniref:sphingolipid delta(4)-desaturase DES1-like isoform X1 n=1 Tax=Mya arenaria TaxID=6604 RepID=UPI0022E10BEC|nr:sphingolipid delta(4)-desaturase DES1-like isoform X1 [Mya arenaria]XP_052770562.1 sphingolipid delta(4)-desaturase DES1-like isoform X1 [Mya arenaria]
MPQYKYDGLKKGVLLKGGRGTMETMNRFLRCASLRVKMLTAEDEWSYDEEPHSRRRKEILKAHPEIKELMGYDSNIAYIVIAEVIAQMVMSYVLMDASWSTVLICGYVIGGVLNHSLGSAIHEIGHNLAFGHGQPVKNRLLSIFCNVPIIAPMAISYKKYHADHHRYLGHEYQDVDIPTRLESFLFRRPITKIIWLIFHPLIHALRPFYKSPKPITGWEMINNAIQLIVNVLIIKVFGMKSFVYCLSGTLFGLGFHPLAGHFISEHYVFTETGQATMSYYGPLNFILFNVGYHIEHHDFPYIPYNKLPEVKKIAPEFYQQPYHTSWIKVLWDFIFDPSHGPQARSVGYHVNPNSKHAVNGVANGNGVKEVANGNGVNGVANSYGVHKATGHNGSIANGHAESAKTKSE